MMRATRIEKPPRPYLPPSMAGAATALAAAAGVLELGWSGYLSGSTRGSGSAYALAAVLAAIGALVLLDALAFWRRRAARRDARPARRTLPLQIAVWMGIGLLVGACAAAWGVAVRRRAFDAISSAPASSLVFRVESDGTATDYGMQYTVDAHAPDGTVAGSVRLICEEPIEAGTEVAIVGRTSALDDGTWGRGRYMAGSVAEIQVIRVRSSRPYALNPIARVRAAILDAIDPSAGAARALIAGIVCGRTTELNACEESEAFARTGTSHLVAVSGSHLAFVSALGSVVLTRMGVSSRVRGATLAGVMGAYVLFTGCAASALRSFDMVVLSLVASMSGRRAHGLSALALSAIGLVALDAGIVYDLGFQLSALSVLFIQLFGRYLSYGIEVLGAPRTLADALALTVSAQWATLPVTIPVFGTCSLIAPVSNLVLGPIMSALLVVGLAATPIAAFAPMLAPCMIPVGWLAQSSIFLAQLFSEVPGASIAIAPGNLYIPVLYGAAAVAFLIWPDVSRRIVVVAAAMSLGSLGGYGCFWRYFAPPGITVLDVGQADAILVRDGSSAVLVDAGVDSEVVTALARNHVFYLDAIVITHWDRDHCGGLPDILDTVPVGRMVLAEGAHAGMPADIAACAIPPIQEMRLGDTLVAGSFTCEMVWPHAAVEGSENEESLVLAVRYEAAARQLDLLLTGDTEVDEAMEYAPLVGDIDVLKVGHHGSRESVRADLLDLLDPELAIASAGEGNAYGHPTETCMDTLRQFGTAFLCTKDVGDVLVEPGAAGVRVHVERDTPALRHIAHDGLRTLRGVTIALRDTISADALAYRCGIYKRPMARCAREVNAYGRIRAVARLPDRWPR